MRDNIDGSSGTLHQTVPATSPYIAFLVAFQIVLISAGVVAFYAPSRQFAWMSIAVTASFGVLIAYSVVWMRN